MQLTKVQIHTIEKALKKHGANYWDLRIELLDHIASLTEKELQTETDFNIALKNSVAKVAGNDLNGLIKNRKNQIAKNYGQLFKKSIKNFYSSPKNAVIIVILILLYIYLYKSVSSVVFKKIAYLSYAIPIITVMLQLLKDFLKKQIAIHVEHIANIVFLPFLILTGLTGIFSEKSTVINDFEYIIYFVFSPLCIPITYIGFNLYLKTRKKTLAVYRKMIN